MISNAGVPVIEHFFYPEVAEVGEAPEIRGRVSVPRLRQQWLRGDQDLYGRPTWPNNPNPGCYPQRVWAF